MVGVGVGGCTMWGGCTVCVGMGHMAHSFLSLQQCEEIVRSYERIVGKRYY